MSARWKLSAGPPARGAASDTFLTQTERRCRREIPVMSFGIRYQTQPSLQAVREAAAPSDGEHDPELIPRRLLPVCARGKVLSSRSPSPTPWLLLGLCGCLQSGAVDAGGMLAEDVTGSHWACVR